MVYKLSLEQLNDIVSDAVTNAIKKLENVEIVDDLTPEKSEVKIEEFTDEQLQEAMRVMAANRRNREENRADME